MGLALSVCWLAPILVLGLLKESVFFPRTKWKRQTAVGLELLTEAGNYAALQRVLHANPYWSAYAASHLGGHHFSPLGIHPAAAAAAMAAGTLPGPPAAMYPAPDPTYRPPNGVENGGNLARPIPTAPTQSFFANLNPATAGFMSAFSLTAAQPVAATVDGASGTASPPESSSCGGSPAVVSKV